jgi:hypothetical protein
VVLVERMIEDVMTGSRTTSVVIEQDREGMRHAPKRISLQDLERRLYVA